MMMILRSVLKKAKTQYDDQNSIPELTGFTAEIRSEVAKVGS